MPAPTETAAQRVVDGGQVGGDVAALAPAHAADARGVDPSSLHEVIDAGDDVPRVADAEVAHVELPEALAVAGAAAVVDLQHQRAAADPGIDGVVAVLDQDRTIDPGRSAVDDDEQRILLRRIEIRRAHEHALDRRAVLALPRHDLPGADAEGAKLPGEFSELARLERVAWRRVHLRHRRRRRGGERDASSRRSTARRQSRSASRAASLRVIALVAGSTTNRWLVVFCRPEKTMPAAVQSSRLASSSKAVGDRRQACRHCAGTTAMRPLA